MNLELQYAVLSSIIFDEKLDLALKYNLKLDFFTEHSLKDVYRAMINLHKGNKPIEIFLLKDVLGVRFETLLLEIAATGSIQINEHYTDLLKKYSQIEKIKKNSLEILSSIEKEPNNVDKLKSTLNSFVSDLNEDTVGNLFEIHNFDENKKTEMEFIGEDFIKIPRGTVSTLIADGGIGKSTTALQSAIREANKGLKVFAWLSEDPLGESMKRGSMIINQILKGIDKDKLSRNLQISDSLPFYVLDKNNEITLEFYEFKEKLKNYDYIILDPLIEFNNGDENDNVSARRFMTPFIRWARSENKAILFLHHSGKRTKDGRGAGDFRNSVRSNYILKKHTGGKSNYRTVELEKDNYCIGKSVFNIKLFPDNENNGSVLVKKLLHSSKRDKISNIDI